MNRQSVFPDATLKGDQLLPTDQYAAQNFVQPQTVRKRYAATGSYFGIRPLVMPNGRLMWPSDTIERLLAERKKNYD